MVICSQRDPAARFDLDRRVRLERVERGRVVRSFRMAVVMRKLEPGTILGDKYRILRPLGQGGMGAVWQAENESTSKRVAIKWLLEEAAAHPDGVNRLRREAQAASRIRHRNVVDVYDIARDGDAIFLVMEYLEGESLADYLARGCPPLRDLLELLAPAMRGVAAAHKAGIVHRDIKPANIFLARQEGHRGLVPKILDFGISKVAGAEGLQLTKTGATMGTPLYMSPEQLTAVKDVDERTDIYSFGVILYEAVTGHSPYEADSFPVLAVKIAISEPPPASTFRPNIPDALDHVIRWAMTKDRAARLQSLDEFATRLEALAAELPVSTLDTSEGFYGLDKDNDPLRGLSLSVARTLPGLSRRPRAVRAVAAAAITSLAIAAAWSFHWNGEKSSAGAITSKPLTSVPMPPRSALAQVDLALVPPLDATLESQPSVPIAPTPLEPSDTPAADAAIARGTSPEQDHRDQPYRVRGAEGLDAAKPRRPRQESPPAAVVPSTAIEPAPSPLPTAAPPKFCSGGRAGALCGEEM